MSTTSATYADSSGDILEPFTLEENSKEVRTSQRQLALLTLYVLATMARAKRMAYDLLMNDLRETPRGSVLFHTGECVD